jgi:hypothetical protein
VITPPSPSVEREPSNVTVWPSPTELLGEIVNLAFGPPGRGLTVTVELAAGLTSLSESTTVRPS